MFEAVVATVVSSWFRGACDLWITLECLQLDLLLRILIRVELKMWRLLWCSDGRGLALPYFGGCYCGEEFQIVKDCWCWNVYFGRALWFWLELES